MRAEQRECPPSRRRRVTRSQDDVCVDHVLQAWVGVMRFGRSVSEALRAHGISFALFRVLEATDRCVREMGDAVSQQDVVQACALGKSSVCSLMRTLEQRGLVEIGLDPWGFAQRITLTAAGRAALTGARRAVLQAARHAGLYPEPI
jgi:DNA-binding MarR family transcriptional regulator